MLLQEAAARQPTKPRSSSLYLQQRHIQEVLVKQVRAAAWRVGALAGAGGGWARTQAKCYMPSTLLAFACLPALLSLRGHCHA